MRQGMHCRRVQILHGLQHAQYATCLGERVYQHQGRSAAIECRHMNWTFLDMLLSALHFIFVRI